MLCEIDYDPDDSMHDHWPSAPVCPGCDFELDSAPAGAYVDCEGCGACQLSRYPPEPYEPTEADREAASRASLAQYVSPALLRARLLALGCQARDTYVLRRDVGSPLRVEFPAAPPARSVSSLTDALASVPHERMPPAPACRSCGVPLWREPAGVYIDCPGCGACELSRWGQFAAEVDVWAALSTWAPAASAVRAALVAEGWRGETRYAYRFYATDGCRWSFVVPLDPADPQWIGAVMRILAAVAYVERSTFERVFADVSRPEPEAIAP